MLKNKLLKPTALWDYILFAALVVLYCFYISQSFKYIYLSIVQHLDSLFLLMIMVLIYFTINSKLSRKSFEIKPIYWHKWNIILFALISLLYPIISFYIKINLITTVLGLIGFYTLFSFILPTIIWKKGIIPFTLLLMCLPFGRQLDTYIGFPLRMLSVDFVATQMKWLGFNLSTRDTILIIENKASQVDIDCSGIKGLWVGLIFFIAYSWINNLRANLKWLGLLFTLIGTILFFNILRVSVLVCLNSLQNFQKGVQYFHYSIAAFGIVLSCLLIHFLAMYFKLNINDVDLVLEQKKVSTKYTKGYLLMVNIYIIVLLFIPQHSKLKPIKRALPLLQSNSFFSMKTKDFKRNEKAVFERDGSAAQKFQFAYKTLGGEAIIIIGSDWRAQHKPELCFEAAGNRLKSVQTLLVSPQHPVKYIKFENSNEVVYSWFQSPQIITEDYSYRNWLELRGQESNWVLINTVVHNNSNQQEVFEMLQYFKDKIKMSFQSNLIVKNN